MGFCILSTHFHLFLDMLVRVSVFMTFIANSKIPPHMGSFLDLVLVNFRP
jgi:hypothetical protein